MRAALRSDSPLRSKSDAFDLQTPLDFPIHDRGAPASQRFDGLCTESVPYYFLLIVQPKPADAF